MDIIPVIDVRHGEVVRAVKGDRANYKPIITPLAASTAPDAIARSLASLFAFRQIYLADIDGIEGRGRNVDLVTSLGEVFPKSEIWVDAGTGSRSAARTLLAQPATTLVVGSESLESVGALGGIIADAPGRSVLSLDFRFETFLGPDALLEKPELWPHRIIAMQLGRVGSGEGPDIDRLRDIVRRANGRRVYASGGIRHRADLDAVRAAGAAGALIASALHDQKITADELKEFAGRKGR